MALSTSRSLALLSCLSFYIGFLTNHEHHTYNTGHIRSIGTTMRHVETDNDEQHVIEIVQQCYHFNYFSEEVQRRIQRMLHHSSMDEDPPDKQASSPTHSFLTGMASISKQDLMKTFDAFGVATMMDPDPHNNESALLLYQTLDSLPSPHHYHAPTKQDITRHFAIHIPNTSQALEHCDTIHIQFLRNRPPKKNAVPATCSVWIPTDNNNHNLPSFHVQRWMRSVHDDRVLRHVGSLAAPNGENKFDVPKSYHPVVAKHWVALRRFLEHVDDVLEDVRRMIEERWRLLLSSLGENDDERTVIVMTVNRGDADLLFNFLCAAKSRHLDVRRILVFVIDEESQRSIEALSKDAEDGLGVMVYFDRWNLANVSQGGEAQKYGDGTFVSMMFAKILCVLYVSLLGYDVLYQDADIVWYDNPISFFHNNHPDAPDTLSDYDVIFQHDGSKQPRFSPYSANSGFYYVRSNTNTQYLFISLLYHGDLVRKTTSHQQVLTHLLLEHSSLFGLRVKVLDGVTVFPGGYQYQYDRMYMHKLLSGQVHPLIFHMYWTNGKESKVKFLKQLGEWYVQNECLGDSVSIERSTIRGECCSTQPIISCFYRDKPSKVPCVDSPLYDKTGTSFW